LSEIIVVDDGSNDSTAEEVSRHMDGDPRLRLIRHDLNLGKGQAVYTGWRAARSPCILMLDGDLIGFSAEHVRALVQPVVTGRADMTLGLFRGGRFSTDLSHWLTPWLTGQRCLRANLFHYVAWHAAEGYGLETALTVMARQQRLRCQRVPLYGVTHPPSEFHRGFWRGVRTRLRMYAQVVRAWVKASTWGEVFVRSGWIK